MLTGFLLSVTLASTARADAKVFARPDSERIPGQYFVLFKSPEELLKLPRLYADVTSGVKKPHVLPDTLPIARVDSRALAGALTKSVHGRVLPPYESPYENRQGFWIELPERMVSVLAKDPRIESIEPNAISHLDAPASEPTPNSRWRGP